MKSEKLIIKDFLPINLKEKNNGKGKLEKNPLKDKSYQFAIRIVKLSQYLQRDKKEFVLSKQVLRSGTAVGALIREAEFGQSRADFTSKRSMS